MGAQQRLRALRVRLVDLDDDAELRDLALDRARREQLGIGGERRATVHPERLGHAGDEEQQPDVRVGEDVAQRVGDAVARTLGQQQRAVVDDLDEPGRVAPRAQVAVAVGVRRRDAQERRPVDVLPGERIQPVRDLRADDVGRPPDERRGAASSVSIRCSGAVGTRRVCQPGDGDGRSFRTDVDPRHRARVRLPGAAGGAAYAGPLMDVTTAMLADFAQVREGLLFVSSGGITRCYREQLPAPLGVHLAIVLELDRLEAERPHEVRVVVVDEDGRRARRDRG